MALTKAVAGQWADEGVVRGWHPREAACLTHTLLQLLLALGGPGIEACAPLLSNILQVRMQACLLHRSGTHALHDSIMRNSRLKLYQLYCLAHYSTAHLAANSSGLAGIQAAES
jgi:hypothetical protein